MSKKVEVRYSEPIDTLGGLRVALDELVVNHPNPGEDPRKIKVRVTVGGKVRGFEIEEAE